MLKRGMCFEEDMQNLFYKEDWKSLVNGVKYRRVGTDVEIKIAITTETIFTAYEMKKIATLNDEYKADYNVLELLIASLNDEYFNNIKYLQFNLQQNGDLYIQNTRNTSITVKAIKGSVKYSIL